MSQDVNKIELRDTPMKLVMLMLRVHTTGPYPIKVSKGINTCGECHGVIGGPASGEGGVLDAMKTLLHRQLFRLGLRDMFMSRPDTISCEPGGT